MRLRKLIVACAIGTTTLVSAAVVSAPVASAQDEPTISYYLVRAENPSEDQLDAYERITTAMDAAVSHYNDLSDLSKNITVHYEPGVPTAEANINGDLRFGSNRSFMVEATAMHEISHTLGVGQSGGWYALSGSGTWSGPEATALLQKFDGADARLNTGGGHFWPYGLNYDYEFSPEAADRHVLLMQAMVDDGM